VLYADLLFISEKLMTQSATLVQVICMIMLCFIYIKK